MNSSMAAKSRHHIHLLRRLFGPKPPSSSYSPFLSHLNESTLSLRHQTNSISRYCSKLPFRRSFCSPASSSCTNLSDQNLIIVEKDDNIDEDKEEIDEANEMVKAVEVRMLNLSVKEKRELASYAHGLGVKLNCQLVGKSGVTVNVVTLLIENLESNELVKIKIHKTCPGEFSDVVKQLEETTGSVVVGEIGRTAILYRPSLTKLNAGGQR